MPTQNPEISLSQEELIYLLSLLKTPPIPGLAPAPMQSLGQEQVNVLMAAAERSLIARGFVEIKPDKTVGIDQVVLALVGTCALPELSILVTASFDRGSQLGQFYHASQKMAVEHAIVEPGIHRFAALHKVGDFVPRILGFIHLTVSSTPPGGSVSVPQETFQTAAEIAARAMTDAIPILTSAGLGEDVAESLATALAKPVSNSAIVVVRQSSASAFTSDGFAILEGPVGPWVMQPQSDNGKLMVNLTPASSSDVQRRIGELLNEQHEKAIRKEISQ